MRGQKSKSSPGVRRGFEGGQMPLYRRIPKLRGIAGGMHAGLPKYVPVNLKDIAEAGFQEGEEVLLKTLKKKGLINPSGRERKTPFKACFRGCATVSARQLRDALLKKVARRKVLRLQAQKDRSSVVDELRQELREYREIVKYNICLDPPKEVVITKCYHLFCNPCSKNYRKLSSQVSGLCCKFWP